MAFLRLLCVFSMFFGTLQFYAQEKGKYANHQIDGYRPIWYSLGQTTEYGPKYSGGLGTYTMKHTPTAIYCKETNKTYFVYGGTIDKDERYLLCMIGCFDHSTGMVCKPTVVYDKLGVDDPHDDPSILIDSKGNIFVYVAGRSKKRNGYIYKSKKPYDISEFESVGFEELMAYPQPHLLSDGTHFLFFTRYDGVRQLFFRTSPDGKDWSSPYQQIASIKAEGDKKSGHYQITSQWNDKLVTAFNRHLNGDCDTRTNIYYLQTTDGGKTWTLADGTPVKIPITKKNDTCRILNKEDNGQNVYIKDVNFDSKGNPIILYLTCYGPYPGPQCGPREWFVMYWNGKNWKEHSITTSTNNYDSGSLYVENDKLWRVIAPLHSGPQLWGPGGEIESWVSTNKGKSWKKEYTYTMDSPNNHNYCRRPVNADKAFYSFWTDGNFYTQSISYLYIGDSQGNTYQLPYYMNSTWQKPILVAKKKEQYNMLKWKGKNEYSKQTKSTY